MPDFPRQWAEWFGWCAVAVCGGSFILGVLRGVRQSMREHYWRRYRKPDEFTERYLAQQLREMLERGGHSVTRAEVRIVRPDYQFTREVTYGAPPKKASLTPEEVDRILQQPGVEGMEP